MANYCNIDIGRVTITVKKEEIEQLSELLGDLADGKQFYEGWITNENPSPSPIGFKIGFDGSLIYADFFNLQYYYHGHMTWEEYRMRIVSHVTRHPSFSSWEGHASRFDPQNLKLLIALLDELAGRLYESPFSSVFPAPSPEVLPAPPPQVTAPPPAPLVREDGMPVALRDYLEELERWALANKKAVLWDTIAFWALKLPAIFVSASTGIWAYFHLPTVSIICGAIASFCIIIDGIHPRGMLRNTHLRAYHDIRILTSRINNQYRSRPSTATADNTSRRLIKEAEVERQKIASYIREAETALTDKLQSK